MSLIWVSTLHTTFWQCLLLLIIAAPAYAISELLTHDRNIYGDGGKEQAEIITRMVQAYLIAAIVFVCVGYCHIFAFSFAIITRPDWVSRKFDRDRDGTVSASELRDGVTRIFRSKKSSESEKDQEPSSSHEPTVYEDGSKLKPHGPRRILQAILGPCNARVQGARIGVTTQRLRKACMSSQNFLTVDPMKCVARIWSTRRS